MHAVNRPFEVVQTLYSGGTIIGNLTNADFPSGTVQLRKVNPGGASGAPIALAAGTDFSVEELWASEGTYALKFADTVVADVGIYGIRIYGGPSSIDLMTGVLRFAPYAEGEELLWLNGKNTVGIVGGYDTAGNPTSVNVYGFATAADTELFMNDPSAHGALVRHLVVENYVYEVSTGRATRYMRRVL